MAFESDCKVSSAIHRNRSVFVSCTGQDKEWVEHFLIPRLEEWGFSILWDKDFCKSWRPKPLDKKAAWQNSLAILMVLSPEYVDAESEWLPLLPIVKRFKSHQQLKHVLEAQCFVFIIVRECSIPKAFESQALLNWADEEFRPKVFTRLFQYLEMARKRSDVRNVLLQSCNASKQAFCKNSEFNVKESTFCSSALAASSTFVTADSLEMGECRHGERFAETRAQLKKPIQEAARSAPIFIQQCQNTHRHVNVEVPILFRLVASEERSLRATSLALRLSRNCKSLPGHGTKVSDSSSIRRTKSYANIFDFVRDTRETFSGFDKPQVAYVKAPERSGDDKWVDGTDRGPGKCGNINALCPFKVTSEGAENVVARESFAEGPSVSKPSSYQEVVGDRLPGAVRTGHSWNNLEFGSGERLAEFYACSGASLNSSRNALPALKHESLKQSSTHGLPILEESEASLSRLSKSELCVIQAPSPERNLSLQLLDSSPRKVDFERCYENRSSFSSGIAGRAGFRRSAGLELPEEINRHKAWTDESSTDYGDPQSEILSHTEGSIFDEATSGILSDRREGCVKAKSKALPMSLLEFNRQLSPRLLPAFTAEDADLSKADVEELTLKLEDMEALLCDQPEATTKYLPKEELFKLEPFKRRDRRMALRSGCIERFESSVVQISVLDSLQRVHDYLRQKIETGGRYDRRKTYRRLLQRFEDCIEKTMNGIKDTSALSGLPLMDMVKLGDCDDDLASRCSCCDLLLHSDKALLMHAEQCVRAEWLRLIRLRISSS